LGTSRFPADAARRFDAQPDAAEWRGRLHLFGIDLRDLGAIEALCAHLRRTQSRLDVLVNNACQTIRRPAAYYSHLLEGELDADALPQSARQLLCDDRFGAERPTLRLAAPAGAGGGAGGSGGEKGGAGGGADEGEGGGEGGRVGIGASAARMPSALWSQAPVWEGADYGDGGADADARNFPLGKVDVNGSALDLRSRNSWLLTLGEVSTPEAAEALAVNALAPFVLNSRLRPLLEASPAQHRFVVNVSAMEGKFYRRGLTPVCAGWRRGSCARRCDFCTLRGRRATRGSPTHVSRGRYKTPNHPHTNMAKAALNMMTRTCAEELAASRIYINSVDTGWINDENPAQRAADNARENFFQTPIDEIDAASRILDPVFDALNGADPVHGKFLKDYRQTEW